MKVLPPLVGSTFLKCDAGDLSDLNENTIAFIGFPYEATKVSRPGCSAGPQAVREASFMFAYLLQTLEGAAMIDPVTERATVMSNRNRLIDLGDVGLYPADVHVSTELMKNATRDIVAKGAFPVVIGGDHYISYPSVTGFMEGIKARGGGEKVGYVHIDAHLDLADEMPFFGKLSSGTQVRRMIDTSGLNPENILMIGIGGTQPKAEWDYAKASGIGILGRHELQDGRDIRKAVLDAAAQQLADCTALYLTIDIDVNDRTYAPGTGNAVATGGLLPVQFLEVLDALREFPLQAIDLVEVAPVLDPSGRTASLASQAITTVLSDRLFDSV